MRALIIAALLALTPTVIGSEVDVRALLEAYFGAPWAKLEPGLYRLTKPVVCIDGESSETVDEIVRQLGARAALLRGG